MKYSFISDFALDVILRKVNSSNKKISEDLSSTNEREIIKYLEDLILNSITINDTNKALSGEACLSYLNTIHRKYKLGEISPDGCIIRKVDRYNLLEYFVAEHKYRNNGNGSFMQLLVYSFIPQIALLLDNDKYDEIYTIGVLVTGNFYSGIVANVCNLDYCRYYYVVYRGKLDDGNFMIYSYSHGSGVVPLYDILNARFNNKLLTHPHFRKNKNSILSKKEYILKTLDRLNVSDINSNKVTGYNLLNKLL